MKKNGIKIFFIGLATAYAIGSTTLYIGQLQRNKETISEMSVMIENQEQSLNSYRMETEELKTIIDSQNEEKTTLQNELDSARQRNYELATEIDRIEEVERNFIVSRGRVGGVEFTTSSDVTTARIDNGDLLDLGLSGNLKGLGWAFVNAGLNNGIDPLFLAAISAQESGWGRYDHGNNNIFGIMSGATYFSSYEECINYTAELLAEYYVAEGRYTPALIQPKYCPSPTDWHYNVAAVANTILRNIME